MIDDLVVAPLPMLFMVLASTALLLALIALWTSLRAALGAPTEGREGLEANELPDRAALLDEKKSLLRAIKDLEYEHAVGKISPEDFKRLDLAYRVRAKEVLSLLEQDLLPFQAQAEALLAEHLGAPASADRAEPAKAAAPSDDEALRARARALREEAERLERMAAKAETRDEKGKTEGASKSEGSSESEDAGKTEGSSESEDAGKSEGASETADAGKSEGSS